MKPDFTYADKRTDPLFGPVFWIERESEREWHWCKYCNRDVPTFQYRQGVIGSHEVLETLRCCWECGSGIDVLKRGDVERIGALVRARKADLADADSEA